MATGRKALAGKSSASVMAKILEAERPSMSPRQPMTPPALDRVVKKCLAKEPEDRWQSARDLKDELKWIAAETVSHATPAAAPATPARMWLPWVAISAVPCLVPPTVSPLPPWFFRPPAPN